MVSAWEGTVTYEQWEQAVPPLIRTDTLWSVKAYRLGLFLSDLVWHDADKLLRNPKTRRMADQLFRCSGNISSTIAEGYSRDTGKARATFYEYACGSARESRDWYYKSRMAFTPKLVDHRLDLTTQIVKLTLRMISTERRSNRRASD